MAEDRNSSSWSSSEAAGVATADAAAALALVRPGDPGHAAYPLSEAEYWRQAHAGEPYRDPAHSLDDYAPAYELGWVSWHLYGGDFDVAERVVANDWLVRKGVSPLTWEQARPAVRAAWQRAENARSYATDGSADAARVGDMLQALFEHARDGELGFHEAAGQARTAQLAAQCETLAGHCSQWSQHWRAEIERRGGAAGDGGTVAGAAQRVWLQIRGLLGAAGDEELLAECERGQQEIAAHCRAALAANLPQEVHEAAQHQLEQAQRHADHIRQLRSEAFAAATRHEPVTGSPSLSR